MKILTTLIHCVGLSIGCFIGIKLFGFDPHTSWQGEAFIRSLFTCIGFIWASIIYRR